MKSFMWWLTASMVAVMTFMGVIHVAIYVFQHPVQTMVLLALAAFVGSKILG